MSREISTAGVIGLGTMGAGIVEVFARNGMDVVAVEDTAERAERGRTILRQSTDRAVSRGKLAPEEQDALIGRIRFVHDFTEVAECDLVIEAVPEHLDLKREIFARLDQIVRPDAILATNTSSLSVTEIAVSTQNPRRVLGMHFFNPAPVLKLVEVVRTVVTEDEVVESVKDLAARLGKLPVVIGDKAGFIANALLFGYLNHAVSMYEAQYASREDIDAAMRLGCRLPMGPLALLDLIGLDTAYEICDTMYKQGRDRLHAPSPVLKQMVTAGLTGRKTGAGFYTYDKPGSGTIVDDHLTPPADLATGPVRPVKSVGVVGSGVMATGIIQTFAQAGFTVTFVACSAAQIDEVTAVVARSLVERIEGGRLVADDRAATSRVRGTVSLEDLAHVDLVVESVVADREVKQSLFENLDQICKPGAILATATASMPVIECASVTGRPQDVIGLHFFDPAQVMDLIEVVRTVSTADDVVATAQAVCRDLGKHPVTCGDRAGFIVNALLFPYLNDAVKMLEAHYAGVDDIDTAMMKGCGYPVGPFELLDAVGLDVSLAIQRELYLEVREPGFSPAPLLGQLVSAGRLGRKVGRGFRTYP